MISINMNSLWSDETEKIVKGISEATNNIIEYRNNPNTSKNMFCELIEDITTVCDSWTGKTYVGSPKKDALKNAYQAFYEELMQLLIDMKNSKKSFERKTANAMLFRGTIYRYLGTNDCMNKRTVKPEFNDIYVSWSKCPDNSYLLSKLYGTVTLMTCQISEPLYGIDLEALGCSRGNEKEVVFPTIEKYITDIEYIEEEEEGEDNDQT
mgnify:CR=1 FL=1